MLLRLPLLFVVLIHKGKLFQYYLSTKLLRYASTSLDEPNMGAITPGTNATLKSNTIENILYEALTVASGWENDLVKNPTAEYKVSIQTNFSARRLNATFNFKLDRVRTATGAPSFPVLCQLVSTGYSSGSGAFLISSNIYAAIVEICEEIQLRDGNVNKNPQNLNTVTALNYDAETLTVTGALTLLIDATTDNTGSVVSRARTYLLD